MPPFSGPRRAFAFAVLCTALLAALTPRAAAAQCTPPWQGQQTEAGCEVSPGISLSPPSFSTSQPSVPFTVRARDYDGGLVDSTFHVRVNNTLQAGFSVETFTRQNGWLDRQFVQTGTVPLSLAAPNGALSATVCDIHRPVTECPYEAASYTLAVPGVQVSPRYLATNVLVGATQSLAFTVRNTGTTTAGFAFRPACLDPAGAPLATCSASPASATLAPGAARSVSVTYTATLVGEPLFIKLVAANTQAPGVQDAGWFDATVVSSGTTQSAPVARLVNLNWGPDVVRDQCLVASAGPGAAMECGDLRLVHPLPPHRTRGRTWQPALLYNSQHAQPYPLVHLDVTLPAGALVPDSVDVVLTLDNGVSVRKAYRGADWRASAARRVAVGFDALSLGTGVYPYQVQVTTRYGATQKPGAVLRGMLTVVNRSGSPFGAGWWLAGMESLYCINCSRGGDSLLWVGGDGSARVFSSLPGRTWAVWTARNPGGPPDTLTLTAPAAGPVYTRRLRGGGRVEIDGNGRHWRTVDRLGQVTYFDWQADRLAGVYVPNTGNGVAPAYLFTYDTWNGQPRLTQVNAATQTAQPRLVTLAHGLSDQRVTAITGPDGNPVRFSYVATLPRQINYRTDRRNATRRYTFSPIGRLTTTRVAATPADTLLTLFDPVEGKGVTASYTLAAAFTLIDGPRRDVGDTVQVWHGDWGAPRRIRDGTGSETLVVRGDPRFPALATETVAPGGVRSRVAYDARGRVDSAWVYNPLGDGRHALTTYAYDDLWDAPVRVTPFSVDAATGAAAPLAGSARAEYDPVTGNPRWRQQGDDPALRASFSYYPAGHPHAGQLASVADPATAAGAARDSLVYDGQGNLWWTMNPRGSLTQHVRDGLGRDSVVYTPVDSAGALTLAGLVQTGLRQEILYDRAGRDTLTITVGPAVTHAPRDSSRISPVQSSSERLTVRKRYDAEGAVLQVARWATPDPAGVDTLFTWFQYDATGRKTLEGDSTQVRTFGYDKAGNVTSWTTGRGHTIRSVYDALGRLVRREVPSVRYNSVCYANDGVGSGGGDPGDGGGGGTGGGGIEPTAMDPGGMEVASVNGCSQDPFPRYPNGPEASLVIPEEWTYFRYDTAGRMVQAENGDAIVERGYYPNGALKTDVLRLRTYAGVDFTQHVYAVEYGYDVMGRPTSVTHPQNLAGTGAVDRYTYHPVTGAPWKATDRFGNEFVSTYDNAGQRTALTGPGFVDTSEYDLEGRRTRRLEYTGSAVLHDERFRYDVRGKVLDVDNGSSEYHNWYSGLGMLVATDWENVADFGFLAEEFGTDALGNVYWRRSGDVTTRSLLPAWATGYRAGFGRVAAVDKVAPQSPGGDPYFPERTVRGYDASGNAAMGLTEVGDAQLGVSQHARSHSFYSADQRLRYYQENRLVSSGTSVIKQGVWEEYRYDALGRRVMVRSNREDLCNDSGLGQCVSHLTRYVWSGDQVLWELRADTEDRENLEPAYSTGPYHGRVSYFHAGGIDRPLVIWKDGTTILPHENWRGQFARGTYTTGQSSDCVQGQTSGCTPINWPGSRTTAWHALAGAGPDIRAWYGSLVDGMRDGSGKMYMRNRYYDPATGQFTQPDPIGLAGGLNAYGFAAGDPVSFSDPMGLKVCYKGSKAEVNRLRAATEEATGAAVHLDASNCVSVVGASMTPALVGLRNRLYLLVVRPAVYNVSFRFSEDLIWQGSTCDWNPHSHFCPDNQLVEVDERDVGRTFPADFLGCYVLGGLGLGPTITENLPSIIAHELLGHGWSHAVATGPTYNYGERRGVSAENSYHRTRSEGNERCH
jgi:RHS repeat-associated protein